MKTGGAALPNILGQAWPSVLTNLLFAFVGIVSVRFVSELGADALAAAGAGVQVFYALQITMIAISIGTTALVARSWGAGNREEAVRVTLASLVLGSLLSSVLMIPGIVFAYPIASIFGLNETATQLSADYILWVSVFNIAYAFNFILAAALRAAGDAKTPLWLAICTNIFNLLLLPATVFGFGPIPAQGVAGAAQASGIAFSLSSLLALWLWVQGRLSIQFSWLRFFERTRLMSLIYISYPAAVEQAILRLGFFAFMIIIGRYYGAIPFAAYNIGVNLLSLCFVVGYGFSIAASTVVGQHLGKGNAKGAERSVKEALWLSIISMTLIGAVIILFAETIARLMVSDEQVLHDTVVFIYILGFCQPLMAVEFAIGGALRGAGDTRFLLWTTLIGLLIVRCSIAGSAALLGLPVFWVYAALIGDYLIKALMLGYRLRSRLWQTTLHGRI